MATAPLGSLVRHIHKLAAGPAPQWTDRQLVDDFAARRDEAAFTTLVARHGPMVLRVCRRVLRHEQDVEDAFQATFLVLARHVGSLRRRESVASWLHGVAHRTAMKARRGAARRRKHEGRLFSSSVSSEDRTSEATGATWDEVQAALDEEIERLPDPHRAAFVLCVLEGKGSREAAADLGVKEGTVWSRVARARQLLHGRLTRRGIKLTALLAALSIVEGVGQAVLPAPLSAATIRFGLSVAAGEPAAAIPSRVAALAVGVTRAMFLSKARTAVVLILAAGLLIAGAGVLARQAPAAGEPPADSHKSEVGSEHGTRPAADDRSTIAYAGRVLGPNGQPVPGAKLYLTLALGNLKRPSPSPEYGATGLDGRFRFTVPKAEFGGLITVIAAATASHGAGWVEVPADGKRDDLTLRLVEDDVPITGQVVDLEGKPVAGATLRVLQINAAPGEDLGPWLGAAKSKQEQRRRLEPRYLSRFTTALAPAASTDAEGRFRLTGIGRNRLVTALLEGPTIATQYLRILTRPGAAIEVLEFKNVTTTYYGASFLHVAAPANPVVGVVRDRDTKKPLAGVTVQSYKMANSSSGAMGVVLTRTDAQGHYRLTGMPKGKGNEILVVPPRDLPYLSIHKPVPDSIGLDPVTVDVELRRGVWIEGKITNTRGRAVSLDMAHTRGAWVEGSIIDRVTGKPLRGGVQYFALNTNPNLPDYDGFADTNSFSGVGTKEDGSYRVVGLPGPGLVAVFSTDQYLRARERDDEYGTREFVLEAAPYVLFDTNNISALARIDPPKGVDAVKRDVMLDPGWTFTGTVLGPDGKPVPGVRGFGLTASGAEEWAPPLAGTASFTVQAFNPRRPRDVLFQHLEKGLTGVAHPPKENGGSVTVRLEPGATVTGRLVDTDGKPRAGVELEVAFRPKGEARWNDYSPRRVKTDRDGGLRLEALLPGYEFRLNGDKGQLRLDGTLRSGQAKDLGDVLMK